MKYLVLTALFVTASLSLTGCKAPSDSTLVFAPMSADGLDDPGIVQCETKGGTVYLHVVDKSGDGHIFRLDHSGTGLTKRQAVARIRKNIEVREASSHKVKEATSQ